MRTIKILLIALFQLYCCSRFLKQNQQPTRRGTPTFFLVELWSVFRCLSKTVLEVPSAWIEDENIVHERFGFEGHPQRFLDRAV